MDNINSKCDHTVNMIHNGNGIFLFPPVTVSEFGNKKLGHCKPHEREIALDLKIDDGIRIIVTEDGFVCPITDLIAQENQKLLNIIVATLTTKFTSSRLPSWESDWASFRYEDGNDFVEIGRSKGGFSIRNQAEFERDDQTTFHLWVDMPRTSIITQALKGFIEQAIRFYSNPEYADDLLLIGESWSLSYEGMEKASFLYGWMIIENMIEQTWRRYIDSLNRSSKEKDFLKSHNSWYISHMIQGLSFAEKIDDDTRESLNKLKRIRNDIVHNRYTVSKNEVWDCMNTAIGLVYDKLNYQDKFLLQHKKLRHIT